jgi:predicted ArsR family transcriptional regulator
VNGSGHQRRLLESTRGRILALLRAESRTVNELAAALNLTDNAVRAHLGSLERDGLVWQLGTRPGIRKPHSLFGLTGEAEQLFPKAYGSLLRRILIVLGRHLPPEEYQASLREVGQSAAEEHLAQAEGKTRDQRIEVALNALRSIGGDAKLLESDGKRFIRGSGCPLSAVTAYHPEACLIAEALVSEIVGIRVRECCDHGETPRCRFEIP